MNKKPLLWLVVLLMVGVGAAVMARPVPADTISANDYEHQVVRAYYDDPAMIQALAWVHPVVLSLIGGCEIVLCTRMPA